MSDDRANRGAPDRARINLNQDYELRYWEHTLGVTEHELRNAVSSVGDSADKVREYLKQRTQRKEPHRAGFLRQKRRHQT